MEHIRSAVDSVFRSHHEAIGYIDPTLAALQLLERLSIKDRLIYEKIYPVIFEYPTAEFVHEDALPVISDLINPSDQEFPQGAVSIWTDDYSNRVSSCGIGRIRRELPSERRRNLGVAFERYDKISIIPSLYNKAFELGYEHFVLVDDNPSNLSKARGSLEDERCGLRHGTVLIDRDGSKSGDLYETDYAVKSMTDLLDIRGTIGGSSIFWAIDFNGPILDREEYTNARMREVIRILESLSF